MDTPDPPYQQAILEAYGETVAPPRTGKRGRPWSPYKVPPPDLRYATVHKTRHKGQVTMIECRTVLGQPHEIEQALARSPVSHKINTAFVEQRNFRGRHQPFPQRPQGTQGLPLNQRPQRA